MSWKPTSEAARHKPRSRDTITEKQTCTTPWASTFTNRHNAHVHSEVEILLIALGQGAEEGPIPEAHSKQILDEWLLTKGSTSMVGRRPSENLMNP